MDLGSEAVVTSVSRDAEHRFTKPAVDEIRLVRGIGVEGDAHAGRTVQHRSRIAADPARPNLRQVHLIHSELFEEVAADGFAVASGLLGENITTKGMDLLGLPRGTVLRFGRDAVVEITGLRNPCAQINGLGPGLLKAVLDRDANGQLVRKTGVMGIVLRDGTVTPGDAIHIQLPTGPHLPLEPV